VHEPFVPEIYSDVRVYIDVLLHVYGCTADIQIFVIGVV
jgi:hypothetical protein